MPCRIKAFTDIEKLNKSHLLDSIALLWEGFCNDGLPGTVERLIK